MDSSKNTAIFSEKEWSKITRGLSLSPRQAQIVHCLLKGYSDKQIAIELGISISTIRTYLERLFAKFDVFDRGELILHVFRHFRKSGVCDKCPHWQ